LPLFKASCGILPFGDTGWFGLIAENGEVVLLLLLLLLLAAR